VGAEGDDRFIRDLRLIQQGDAAAGGRTGTRVSGIGKRFSG
jgi:hypothetical protein